MLPSVPGSSQTPAAVPFELKSIWCNTALKEINRLRTLWKPQSNWDRQLMIRVPGLCREPCYPARSMAYPHLPKKHSGCARGRWAAGGRLGEDEKGVHTTGTLGGDDGRVATACPLASTPGIGAEPRLSARRSSRRQRRRGSSRPVHCHRLPQGWTTYTPEYSPSARLGHLHT